MINQTPKWSENAKIEISIEQFSNLMYINEQLIDTMQRMFNEQVQNGNLKIEYSDENGKILTEEQARLHLLNDQSQNDI